MKKKKFVFAYTEYHLILFLNEYLKNKNEYNYKLYILNAKERRIKSNLNFANLSIEIEELPYAINLSHKLDQYHKLLVDYIKRDPPSEIILFQENTLLSLILISQLKNENINFALFQDGMKPYVKFSNFSRSFFLNKLNFFYWLLKNKLTPFVFKNYLKVSAYGNLNGVQKLYLTDPNYFDNWGKFSLNKIEFNQPDEMKLLLNEVFSFTDVKTFEDEILYFNQPLKVDFNREIELLYSIHVNNYFKHIYIKLHPLTSPDFIQKIKELEWVKIIHGNIPAELLLCNVKNAMIISPYSTILLFNIPTNQYFAIYNILLQGHGLIKKLSFTGLPAEHIKICDNINQVLKLG